MRIDSVLFLQEKDIYRLVMAFLADAYLLYGVCEKNGGYKAGDSGDPHETTHTTVIVRKFAEASLAKNSFEKNDDPRWFIRK